jgi:hypothetical protein
LKKEVSFELASDYDKKTLEPIFSNFSGGAFASPFGATPIFQQHKLAILPMGKQCISSTAEGRW